MAKRDNKFLLFHTYANHVMHPSTDYRAHAEWLVERGLFNGMMLWPDHHHQVINLPAVDWLKQNNLAILVEFYTNDHHNVAKAAMEGFGRDLTAYNEAWCKTTLNYLREIGAGKSFWGLGHEHYDSFERFPPGRDVPASRREGFETYRRWVTTNEHQRHWGPHRYPHADGFVEGRMTDQPETMEFLRQRGWTVPHGLMRGGVLPQNAHYQFEISPQHEVFWWECMHIGLPALQVGASFLRGAAAQYGRRVLADVAPYNGFRTFHDDLEREGANEGVPASPYWTTYDLDGRRLGGYSESLHFRAWMSLWAGGVDMMLHEDSVATHFVGGGRKCELSKLGEAHEKFATLALKDAADRGEVVRTAAVVLPFLHGMCPPSLPGRKPWHDQRRPWHGITPNRGDVSIARFFDAAFPNHGELPDWPFGDRPFKREQIEERKRYGEMIRRGDDLRHLEEKHVTSSRWGDGLDVILDNAPLEVLQRYPALICMGEFDADSGIAGRIQDYVHRGGRAMVSSSFPGLGKQSRESIARLKVGRGVLWIVGADHLLTDTSAECPELADGVLAILDEFFGATQPLTITGPPVQWCASRNQQGLRIYLANRGAQPAPLRCRAERWSPAASAAMDFITNRSIPLERVANGVEFKITLNDFGCALIDIPGEPHAT